MAADTGLKHSTTSTVAPTPDELERSAVEGRTDTPGWGLSTLQQRQPWLNQLQISLFEPGQTPGFLKEKLLTLNKKCFQPHATKEEIRERIQRFPVFTVRLDDHGIARLLAAVWVIPTVDFPLTRDALVDRNSSLEQAPLADASFANLIEFDVHPGYVHKGLGLYTMAQIAAICERDWRPNLQLVTHSPASGLQQYLRELTAPGGNSDGRIWQFLSRMPHSGLRLNLNEVASALGNLKRVLEVMAFSNAGELMELQHNESGMFGMFLSEIARLYATEVYDYQTGRALSNRIHFHWASGARLADITPFAWMANTEAMTTVLHFRYEVDSLFERAESYREKLSFRRAVIRGQRAWSA